MKICIIGRTLQARVYSWINEIPFMSYGNIEKIIGGLDDHKDLICDLLIVMDPCGWNKIRLPKVKVQVCMQLEQDYEYSENDLNLSIYDGHICTRESMKFWKKSDKPTFLYDIMTRWGKFFSKSPCTNFKDYGVLLGGPTPHRDKMIEKSKGKIKYLSGVDVSNKLREIGIGYNIHKWTDRLKHIPTEEIRLGLYLNLGMAIISETLSDDLPLDFVGVIPQYENILEGIDLDKKKLAESQYGVMSQRKDIVDNLEIIFSDIKKEFNL